MNVIGIIPSRFSSTRLPGKPLIDIKGKTMIQRVYEQAKKSKFIEKVIVATDDKRIFDCVLNFGGEAVMTSLKHKTGTDRIYEAASKIKCKIVVNIQGDEPFINPAGIDKAIKPLLEDKRINVSTLAVRIKKYSELEDKNKVKLVLDKENFALYFSRNIIPYSMNKNLKFSERITGIKYYKHIGLYVFRKNYLKKFVNTDKSMLESAENLEQLRMLENGERIKVLLVQTDFHSIDTNRDLELAKRLFRN